MKQTQSDKHSIAWFKIAEYVSRGEKERALGVYRLLSHSFNDDAVARQLEGDIHFACDELGFAIPLYIQSMHSYQKSQRFLEAVAVCEHLIMMQQNDVSFHREAIKLYYVLSNMAKVHEHIEKTLDIILAAEQKHIIQEFLSFLSGYSNELHEYALKYLKKEK